MSNKEKRKMVIPRRAMQDKLAPAEVAINIAINYVEIMDADERLTNAVVKLGEAQNLVADFIDGIPLKKNEDSVGEPDQNETFLDRLEREKDELKIKFTKLNTFIDSGDKSGFSNLSGLDQDLLISQLSIMQSYLSILGIRYKILK